MNIAGRGNLFINRKLVIDLSTKPSRGQAFFGLGSEDVRVLVEGLKAGEEYDLEIRISNTEFAARGSPYVCWGGIRVGGVRKVNGASAIQDAVQLAKDSDGSTLLIFLTVFH